MNYSFAWVAFAWIALPNLVENTYR